MKSQSIISVSMQNGTLLVEKEVLVLVPIHRLQDVLWKQDPICEVCAGTTGAMTLPLSYQSTHLCQDTSNYNSSVQLL